MELKKTAGLFNTYSAKLTYGEILVIRDALSAAHGLGPEGDEILTGFNWFLDNMPAPGEDDKEKSNSPNQAKDATDNALAGLELEPAPGQEGETDKSKPVGPEPEMPAEPSSKSEEDDVLPEPPSRS